MKMIIKVEVFFKVEGENLDSSAIKHKLQEIVRKDWVFSKDTDYIWNFSTLDGRKFEGRVTALTEKDAYNSLK